MSILARNYLDGAFLDPTQTLDSVNPAHRSQVVTVAAQSTPEEVGQAVSSAGHAFRTWREWSWIRRGELIDQLAQLMKRDVESLSTLVTRECGKPFNEARAEVVEALHMAQYVAGLSRLPYGHLVSSEVAAKDSYIVRKPKGVVGIITPWNFPMAVPLWGILPSLLAGNTVVFKPSEETPGCGHRLAELIHEAGFPAGVFNVVHGAGEVAGDALVRHPGVAVICFTGSRAVGRHIQQVASGGALKFVATELGGKNAVIVLDDANLELAVNAAILSAFKTTGQRCVSSNRILVDRSIVEPFTQRFVETARRITVGDGLDPHVFMGPLINPAGVEKYHLHNRKADEEGAVVLLRGQELGGGAYSDGNFVEPFVYRMEHRPGSFVLREEAFSPHVAIVPVDGLEHAVEVYNDTDYGLSMAVITEDFRKWRYVRDHAEFGLGYVNLPSIGAEVHLPFGGVKGSGNGHPAAEGLMESVTHRVAFTVNHAEEIVMAQGLSTKL